MINKEKLHLGQEVLVGKERLRGVIDGLTQNYAGIIIVGGPLMLVNYNDIWEA